MISLLVGCESFSPVGNIFGDYTSRQKVFKQKKSALNLVEVTQIIGIIEASVFALALPSCKDAYEAYQIRNEELRREAEFDEAFISDYLRKQSSSNDESKGFQ